MIEVRQGRADTATKRLVVGASQQWIQPDQLVHPSSQRGDFLAHYSRVAAIPTIAEDNHYRFRLQHATGMVGVEFCEGSADIRAASPTVGMVGYLPKGLL